MNEISSKQSASQFIIGVKFVFSTDVERESHSGTAVTVVLKTGKAWTPIYFTPGKANFSSDSETTFQGKLITSKLTIDVPGSNGPMDVDIARICDRPIVVAIEFSNGGMLIAGGKERKLRFSSKRSTNVVSGYVLSFEYKTTAQLELLNVVS